MTDEKKPDKGGRPTKYTRDMPKRAAVCAARGFTHEEISQVLGICRDTFWEWRLKYPAFEKALIVPTRRANERVKRSLYERANGHVRITEQVVMERTGQYETAARVIEVRVAEPPETGAISLWLRNRDHLNWRDKVDIETSGKVSFYFDDPTQRPPDYKRKPDQPAPT